MSTNTTLKYGKLSFFSQLSFNSLSLDCISLYNIENLTSIHEPVRCPLSIGIVSFFSKQDCVKGIGIWPDRSEVRLLLVLMTFPQLLLKTIAHEPETLYTNCNALLYPIIYESVHLCPLPVQLLSCTIISKLLFRYKLCHARKQDEKMLMSMHECWLMKVKWLQISSLHSSLRMKQWVLMRDYQQMVLIDSS